jgi:hypothetical protein
VAIETPSPTDPFFDDVRATFDAWRAAPGLPIVAVILVVLSTISATPGRNPLILLALFAAGILNLGWLGTQLVWYQRVFDGQRLDFRELLPLTWSFVARYLVLLCLPAVLAAIALVLIALTWHSLDVLKSFGGRAAIALFIAIFQVIGTFIVPALAYTTRKVTRAIPIGLAMLAQRWPRNWMYLLVPAAVTVALGGIGWLFPSTAQTALGLLGAVIYLAFTGAIARYYLWHFPLSPLGRRPG